MGQETVSPSLNGSPHSGQNFGGLVGSSGSQPHLSHLNFFTAAGRGLPHSAQNLPLFTALQQGTINAQENPISNIKLSGFSEVQKYLIKTDHIYDPIPVVMSKKTWDKLDPAAQEIIKKAAKESADWERDYAAEYDEKTLKDWEPDSNGPKVIFLTDEEKAALREAVQPVYDKYASTIGQDLIDAVAAAEPKN